VTDWLAERLVNHSELSFYPLRPVILHWAVDGVGAGLKGDGQRLGGAGVDPLDHALDPLTLDPSTTGAILSLIISIKNGEGKFYAGYGESARR